MAALQALYAKAAIVDEYQQIVGYELFTQTSNVSTAALYSSFVELDAFKKPLSNKRVYIALASTILFHESVASIMSKNVLLELHDVAIEQPVLQRLKHLHESGQRFSYLLRNMQDLASVDAMLDLLVSLRIDMRTVSIDELEQSLFALGQLHIEIVAIHVDSQALFHHLKQLGLTRFQGEFISKAELVMGKKPDISVQQIIDVSNLLAQGESTAEIASHLHTMPTIVVSLFKYLNASQFSLKAPVDSVERVIVLLGREKLKQWLFLMLYAQRDNLEMGQDALFERVVFRVNLLTELCRPVLHAHNAIVLAKVRFMGIISLLDVLTQVSRDYFYRALNVEASLIEAIEHQSGDFGEIFDVMLSIEQYDLQKIERYMQKFDINAQMLQSYLQRSWSQMLSQT